MKRDTYSGKSGFSGSIFNISSISWKTSFPKVQLFWEGHKNVRNCPYGFEIYLVNVKTMRKIAKNFVAFSEKLNFTIWKKFNM